MAKKTFGIIAIVLGSIVAVAVLTGGTVWLGHPNREFNNEEWFGFLGGKEKEEIIIDEDNTVIGYNDEYGWDNVKIEIAVQNFYTYNHPAIPSISVAVYEDLTPETIALGLTTQATDYLGDYIDGGSTDSSGEWTSTVKDFDSKSTYWLVIGGIATTNKSQCFRFLVQGYGTENSNKPTSIYCGTFRYKPVAEESAFAIAWYDQDYASLSAINLTSAAYLADHKVDGLLKFTFSTCSQGLGRDMWSSEYGFTKIYVVFVFTEYNSTASSAISMAGSDNFKKTGTPTGKYVVICELEEIAYQVTESGDEVDPNTAVHWFKWKMDFSGCGISKTYVAATALQFTLGITVGAHWNIDNFANSGAAYSSTWFSDVGSTINVTN